MNIAVTTPRGAFYYENITLGGTTISGEFCTEKIEQKMLQITKQRLKRINCISTDTCDTMLKTTRLLKALPALSHAFMIPCDPHGLQLLIRDICTFSWYQKIVKQANEVVAHFKSSKKQYQLLKDRQREIYGGKPLALVMACDTRWGTYSREVKRLIQIKAALKAWIDTLSEADRSERT